MSPSLPPACFPDPGSTYTCACVQEPLWGGGGEPGAGVQSWVLVLELPLPVEQGRLWLAELQSSLGMQGLADRVASLREGVAAVLLAQGQLRASFLASAHLGEEQGLIKASPEADREP